jgi:uncharacterized damage-inducible protein DinB
MFNSIEAFAAVWRNETASTRKVMETLTDESLAVRITPDNRSLGRLAWHLIQSMHEMLSRTGLEFEGPSEDTPVPSSAAEIAAQYARVSDAMLAAVQRDWTDESLSKLNEMYGETWPNGLTLHVLVVHEVHHRGQMTVLMRQAGLRAPDIYGPTLEQWSEMGMEPPVV